MATPITTVSDFCALITKSRLLPADEVESIHQRWSDDGRGDDQVDQFRKFLISRKFLTDWQAHMVQRGRGEGFFIGAYKIMDRVGKGQMGGVYKAVHTLGQLVALKILPGSKAKDQHVLGRFQREARLLTQLDHPNVVRSYQFGESHGIHFISMEFLEGETLDEVLARRKRLPAGEAVRLLHQALGGLQHLHERRMVHRDLKPANLMLVPTGSPPAARDRDRDADATWDATVKILDIGLGRELFDENVPEGQIETQLTVEGSVLGTPDYLAPEQARDARSADVRADVYSVGCVLYHAIAGRPPFPETNIMTQMLKHATEKPAPLASLVSDVPPGLQAVLDRMLAKRPEDRFQTPAAAADALEPFVGAGAAPAAASVVPAYQAWLENESQADPTERVQPVKASTGVNPRPGSGAAPAAPAKPAKPGALPAKSGANPVAPARPTGAVAKPVPPKPGKLQRPAARPEPEEVEVEVELVAEPAVPVMFAPPPEPVLPPERPLTELDRRDWTMLAFGATGVLFAVGLGYGLARLVRKKQPDDTEEPTG